MTTPTLNVTNTGLFLAASATGFFPCATCDMVSLATESQQAVVYRTTGTLSNLSVHVVSNRAALTIQLRKNTLNGNQVVTTPATPNGTFTDSTHTDTVAAGDLIDYSYTNGAGGTSTIVGTISTWFTGDSVTAAVFAASGSQPFSTASTTQFVAFGSTAQTFAENTCNTSIADQINSPSWKNLAVTCNVNGRGTPTTITNRINGANGTMAVNAAVGRVEDTTHTDTPAAAASVCYAVTTGTGAGSCNLTLIKSEVTTGDGTYSFMGGLVDTIGFGDNEWCVPQGPPNLSPTQAQVQVAIPVTGTVKNLSAALFNNAIDGNVVTRLQVNNVDTALVVTQPATTDGKQLDSTHVVTVNAGDTMAIHETSGGTVGTSNYGGTAVLFTPGAAPAGGCTWPPTPNAWIPSAFGTAWPSTLNHWPC